MPLLFAAESDAFWSTLAQYCIDGLVVGSLFALIAIGYTMVYGIVELINFAHGDVFMLGSLLALTISTRVGLADASSSQVIFWLIAMLLVCSVFCATINYTIDLLVYRPLRGSPKLAALVSAIGCSFILMNVGLFWIGAADQNFPQAVSGANLLGERAPIRIAKVDLLVLAVIIPSMAALTLFVKRTRLGRAMRAAAQDPVAARLMGINVDRVIGITFLIGGGLAGVAAVIYGAYIKTVGFQIGYQNGLYAFTAAVLGGIGSIPGAVIGGLIIGLVLALGTGFVGANWTSALVFLILIVILVFKPGGIMGGAMREKV